MRLLNKRLAYVVVFILLFLQSPTWQWLKSVSVMAGYSAYEGSYSLLADRDVTVLIPGGTSTKERDWYPFVMIFNDDYGFSHYIGEEARMTVMYNFGYFSPIESQSDYYDDESPYYNSFYGAYAVAYDSGEPFGFVSEEGILRPDVATMVQVPAYDMKHLVLNSIGCTNPVFDYELIETGKHTLLSRDEWDYFDALITVNGSLHTYRRAYQAYIQYGRPPMNRGKIEAYSTVSMYGRIYGKYIEEKQMTLFFYCIAMDKAVIDQWEEDYMGKTTISY